MNLTASGSVILSPVNRREERGRQAAAVPESESGSGHAGLEDFTGAPNSARCANADAVFSNAPVPPNSQERKAAKPPFDDILESLTKWLSQCKDARRCVGALSSRLPPAVSKLLPCPPQETSFASSRPLGARSAEIRPVCEIKPYINVEKLAEAERAARPSPRSVRSRSRRTGSGRRSRSRAATRAVSEDGPDPNLGTESETFVPRRSARVRQLAAEAAESLPDVQSATPAPPVEAAPEAGETPVPIPVTQTGVSDPYHELDGEMPGPSRDVPPEERGQRWPSFAVDGLEIVNRTVADEEAAQAAAFLLSMDVFN